MTSILSLADSRNPSPSVSHPRVSHPRVSHPRVSHPSVSHPSVSHPSVSQSGACLVDQRISRGSSAKAQPRSLVAASSGRIGLIMQ